MDNELKRLLRQIMESGAFVNGSPTVSAFDQSTDSLQRISDNVGQPQSRANFQSLETMVGVPDAANSNLDDILRSGFDSSSITANSDGSVLERLEDLFQANELQQLLTIADFDNFDVADADANTERWNVGYINGTEGGAANINTTVAGKLYTIVDPDVTPTAAAYGAFLSQPIVSKYFAVVVDVDSTFGTPSVSWATTGMRVSPLVYDANNVVYIQRQNSSGGVLNRIAGGALFGGANQGEVYFTTSDAALAFKIERWDNVWRLYYSLTQFPDYVWVFLTQYEDASEDMDSAQSVYLDSYTPGSADAETAQGNFDNFQLYTNSYGILQAVAGDYDSSAVAANRDGSLIEREEEIADDTDALLADIGDASAATLGSVYGILGNPATAIATQVAAIQTDVGDPSARANFQSLETMIGIPDAANSNLDDIVRTGYDSSATTGNRDGAVLERLENLKNRTADTASTHDITTVNDQTETDVFEIANTTRYGLSVYFDLNALVAAAEGGTVTVRYYNKIDETTYREIASSQFVVASTTTHPNFEAMRINHNFKATIQCNSDVTVTRQINYRYITEDLE